MTSKGSDAAAMKSRFFKIAIVASLFCASSASLADAMTCETFRKELWKAIDAAGDKVAQPRLDHLAYGRPDGTMKRYEMTGIVGIEGSLRCAGNDKLEAFGATAKVGTDDGALRLYRLTALGAATICAVAPAKKPVACKRLADKLSKAAVKGFVRATVRGEEDPSDFRKEDIGNGYGIEFDAREGELSFDLAPPLR
jgi:hypothetical protein